MGGTAAFQTAQLPKTARTNLIFGLLAKKNSKNSQLYVLQSCRKASVRHLLDEGRAGLQQATVRADLGRVRAGGRLRRGGQHDLSVVNLRHTFGHLRRVLGNSATLLMRDHSAAST